MTDLPETLILICRNPECGSDWGVQDAEDGECLSCGLGVVDPADRPAGHLVPATPLPFVLAGGTHKCLDCGRTFAAATYIVERRCENGVQGFICRYCAHLDVDLTVWQDVCDVADVIDALMMRADDDRQRQLFAGLVGDFAEHFAVWRNPPPGDIEPSTSPRSR